MLTVIHFFRNRDILSYCSLQKLRIINVFGNEQKTGPNAIENNNQNFVRLLYFDFLNRTYSLAWQLWLNTRMSLNDNSDKLPCSRRCDKTHALCLFERISGKDDWISVEFRFVTSLDCRCFVLLNSPHKTHFINYFWSTWRGYMPQKPKYHVTKVTEGLKIPNGPQECHVTYSLNLICIHSSQHPWPNWSFSGTSEK